MNRKYNIISTLIILAFGVPIISLAQSPKLVLLDEATKNPVTFAFIYSKNYNTLSDSVGVVFLPECSDINYTVTHINYKEYIIKCKEIKGLDTLYLSSHSYNLEEVTIASKKYKSDYYKLLNRLLNKYRKNRYSSLIRYNYLLRNIKNGRVVERISSNISVNYSVGNTCTFPSKWLNYGSFEFTSEAPFLSLDIEQLIFNLQAFHNTGNYKLLTSGKLRKREHSVELIGCDLCNSDQIKLKVESKDQICLITVDLSKENVINATYIINSNANLPFFRVADGSNILFEQLILNFKFDASGVPQVIDGEIHLSIQEIPLQTKFVLYKNAINDIQSFEVLGNPKFTNIYQQLIFQPNIYQNYIDTSSYFIDTSLLSKFNEDFRKLFLEYPLLGNRYKYLNGEIDSIPLHIHFINDDYYIDENGKFTKYHNDLVVYQAYNIQKSEVSDSVVSIFPILDLGQSRIFSKNRDPYIIQWVLNLACYLYEVDRQVYLEHNEKNETVILDSTIIKHQAEYLMNKNSYNDYLDEILMAETIQISKLMIINHVIDSLIGINVFKLIINKEYSCFECKKGLVRELMKEGWRSKRMNSPIIESRIYFENALIGLNQLFEEVRQESLKDNKVLGSYFHQLAEVHIELNNIEEACQCIEKTKFFWPEAYNISKVKNFYEKNCLQ
jgi:hypothetical protein